MFSLTRVVKDLVVRPGRGGSGTGDVQGGLRTLARVALAPLSQIPMVAARLPELLRTLGERGLAIPPERRRTPNAGLALRALAGFVRGEGEVRDSYLSVLTATMDRAVADAVHPSFIDVLGQLGGDEIRVLGSMEAGASYPVVSLSSRLRHGGASRVELRHFSVLGARAGCTHPDRTPAYLDNLARLGLVELRPTRVTDDVRMFQELEEHPTVTSARTRIEGMAPVQIGPLSETIVADFTYKSLSLTAFGRTFRAACFFRADAVGREGGDATELVATSPN
jgi:hypothetical protein